MSAVAPTSSRCSTTSAPSARTWWGSRSAGWSPSGSRPTPALVVAARQDPSLPPEHSERIAAAVLGSRYEIVDAAHLCCVERPDQARALVAGHLG